MAYLPRYIQEALDRAAAARAAAAKKPPSLPLKKPPAAVPSKQLKRPAAPSGPGPAVPGSPPEVPRFDTEAGPGPVTPVYSTAGLATYRASERGTTPVTTVSAAAGLATQLAGGRVAPPPPVVAPAPAHPWAAAYLPAPTPTGAIIPSIVHGDISQRLPPGAVVNTALTGIVHSVNRATAATPPPAAPGPRVPIGSQRTFGDQVFRVFAHDAYGNPVYRQLGSAGPPDFQTLMTGLAIQAMQGGPEGLAAETRFRERLQFVNAGYGGSTARHEAAVVNLALQLNRGNYPDILSDMTVRELPWQQMGFASYQDYLRYLGYQDLDNGTWRRQVVATRGALGIPGGPGGGEGERGTSGSRAAGSSFGGQGSFFDLVNWRV